jgi:pyruvate-ferredoxin/flavodoxin oxidoreductase
MEAEAHPGPSLIIAYSHCIAHGYEMSDGLEHQKLAVESGYWPLYRFDPRRAAAGGHALVIDSFQQKCDVSCLLAKEARFQVTAEQNPERFHQLSDDIHRQIARRLALYDELAKHG